MDKTKRITTVVIVLAAAVQAHANRVTDYDLDRDGDIDFSDVGLAASAWLEQQCGLSKPCNGADVYPAGGDGIVNFRDFARIAAFFGQCTDPTNPDCNHLPVTLFEPPPQAADITGPGGSVRLFSGEFTESVVDMHIPGRGIDFTWARTYRSRTGSNTAAGNGWDFSYNIFLEQYGASLIVHDGTGRRDVFRPQSFTRDEHIWTMDGFFRELHQEDDGSFTMIFPDTGTWSFLPLDDANAPGKISAITDRNGNSIGFEYDDNGRLTTVRDSLDTGSNGRVVTIGYDPNDLIDSITDWLGRQVKYEYYEDGDANGSAGDLKSVTTPLVVDTNNFPIPGGHEYPDGKTTTYSYSTGFADEDLNHNLLTITDPNGFTYLRNVFATNPNGPDFDRVVRQTIGGPDDIVDVNYVLVVPDANNGFSSTRTVVNDRAGSVSEYFYDNFNRLVVARDHTGRADPNLPTSFDPNSNVPVNPLRRDDPSFFETRYQYNEDSLPTRIDSANGNSLENVYELEVDPNALPRSRGNLSETRRFAGALEPVSDQNEIVELFEYDPNVNHGTNFVTRRVDGRGNETLYEYDVRGNLTRRTDVVPGPDPNVVHEWRYNIFGQLNEQILPDNGSGSKRLDRFDYYSDPNDPNFGYLREVVVDVNNLALTTRYEYDSVGNSRRVIDPNGNDTQLTINQLNQLIRVRSREVNGVRYESERFYDKNDNVIRIDVKDINESGLLAPDPNLTTQYVYDSLNFLTRTISEVNSVRSVVTEYEYDDNRNRTLVRSGEATSGNEPNNVVRTIYDERDLVFQAIRADGDANRSTTQYDYDGNRNLIRVSEGTEDTPNVTTYVYDGYDRRTRTTDAMGNVTELYYDENGNTVTAMNKGELIDYISDANNVRLNETTYEYDALDRLVRSSVRFFDPNTQLPIDDGNSITTYQYSENSQTIVVIDDLARQKRFSYDSANRASTVTDPRGNRITFGYDRNSNVVSTREEDVSDLPEPNQTFVTTYAYDTLDRRVRVIDNIGNVTRYAYDSRDNPVRLIDARDNETRYVYDGLGRRISVVRDMDGDGADAGDSNDIVTVSRYDDNSRLTSQTDDNGNTTTYEYDSLNRLVRTIHADGTSQTTTYDVHDDPVQEVDARGTAVVRAYDRLHRLTRGNYAPGPGVNPATTFQEYDYDGLSRLVCAQDDDSVVKFTYDSMSNRVAETLNGRTTTSVHDSLGNALSRTYPGGRVVTRMYDELNRIIDVFADGLPVALQAYVGKDRLRVRLFGNNAACEYDYDAIRRIVSTLHSDSVGNFFDDRVYDWDPTHNKTLRQDLRIGGPQLTHEYAYDPMHRLTRTTVLDSALPPSPIRETEYMLDGVGNRFNVVGPPAPGPYLMDPTLPAPGDSQMNQYSQTPFDLREYDENGNTVQRASAVMAPVLYAYDVLDRLVDYNDTMTGEVTTYSYDSLGRRISKVTTSSIGPPEETRYYYDGHRVIEERDGADVTQATYVHGGYIDELLHARRGTSDDYYYHADDNYNVMAVTDALGAVVERYEYGDYGEPEVYDALGRAIGSTAVGNPYLFNSRRYDPETGWYYYRTRHLDPQAGRFTSRDTIGPWGDSANLGNGNTYAGNNPWSNLDPFGQAIEPRDVLKTYFETGDIPTEDQFGNLIDSFINRVDDGPGPFNHTQWTHIGTRSAGGPKFKAGADLSKKVNIAGGGGGGGHVTVLKARGHHHGHVTVLKARGGGGGHVTVLKLHGGGVPALYPENDKPEKIVVKGTGHSSPSTDKRKQSLYFPETMHHTREHILLGRQVGIPSSSSQGRIPAHLRHRDRAFIPEIDDEVLTSKKLFVGGLSWHSPGPKNAMNVHEYQGKGSAARHPDFLWMPTRGPGGRRHTHRGHVTVLK